MAFDEIITGDCVAELAQLPAGCVDLVFADPPFNIGYEYDVYDDRRANPAGKVPDDTWVLRPQEDERFFQPEDDTWYVPRVCGTFKERTGHPCQMPEAVLERIIRVATNPGEVVLAPFAGSGTTLATAYRLGRRYVGVELSPAYADAVRERLARLEEKAACSACS